MSNRTGNTIGAILWEITTILARVAMWLTVAALKLLAYSLASFEKFLQSSLK